MENLLQNDKISRVLTNRQRRFVEEYLIDLNATQAAIRAGYSPRSSEMQASRLLSNDKVRQAVDAAMSARAKRVEASQDYVLRNLLEIVERTMQRAPVVDMKGEQIQDEEGNNLWAFDAKNAIAALGKIGDHLGMFKNRSDSNSSQEKIRQLADAVREAQRSVGE